MIGVNLWTVVGLIEHFYRNGENLIRAIYVVPPPALVSLELLAFYFGNNLLLIVRYGLFAGLSSAWLSWAYQSP
jgi:hypothetical protein